MKRKRNIVGLVMALILVFSLGVVPAVAGAAINVPPVAQAGPDQAVHQEYTYDGADEVTLGDYPDVTLDGRGSFDLNQDDVLTFLWEQIGGPTANIANPGSEVTDVSLDGAGTYVFKLTVTDDEPDPFTGSDTDTVTVIAGETYFVRVCGADGWDGRYYSFIGMNHGPFRTITHAIDVAVDGDRILVGPTPDPCNAGTTYYGGTDNPENIVVEEWLTIQSLAGRENTNIDISAQGGPDQVVLIQHDRVVFGSDGHGFTVTGADTGILAVNSAYVYIHQNRVVVEECGEIATGIAMLCCRMPVIEDNIVEVRCALQGTGIFLFNSPVGCAWNPEEFAMGSCKGAQLVYNTVSVDAEEIAEGIILIGCPEAYLHANDVDVMAGPACEAIGIGLYGGLVPEDCLEPESPEEFVGCDKSELHHNMVTVTVDADVVGSGIGIEVIDSTRVKVGIPGGPNDVDVQVTATAACAGGLMGIGIHMLRAPLSEVVNNDVDVNGFGTASNSANVAGQGIAALETDELDALEQVMEDLTGQQAVVALAGALVLGILVCDSDYINVTGDRVNATGDICVQASDTCVLGAGAVLSFGITVLCSTSPMVSTNQVFADSDAEITVTALEVGDSAVGIGGGLAAGFGIVVALCPPDPIHGFAAVVAGNSVEAYGDVIAEVWATGVHVTAAEEPDSVLAVLDANVLSVVYDIVTDSAESEEVGAQVSGNPQDMMTFAAGGALGIGIGVTTMWSNGAQVTDNPQIIGEGTVDVTVVGLTDVSADFTGSLGGGLGLGIGILDVWCWPTTVSGNGAGAGTVGHGYAAVDVEAAEITSDQDCAGAHGGGAGIGLGILVIGPFCCPAHTQVDDESIRQMQTTATVQANSVQADGEAMTIVQAFDMMPEGSAYALGSSLSAAMGIVVSCHWCPVVAYNTVDALGYATADVYAAAISAVDPVAMGVSAGIGVGIMSAHSPGAQITDNTAYAEGLAAGVAGALEEMVLMEMESAGALGTSIGAGMGMVLAGSDQANVSTNYAEGTGNAYVDVIAEDVEPLQLAWTFALGVGIGNGIVVAFQDCACVKESNVFEAGADVAVLGNAVADYVHRINLGLALAVDAAIMGVPHGVAFNYNDMPGLVPSYLNIGGFDLDPLDWGMLVLCSNVDARYNWWGDPTGPMIPARPNGQMGQAIVWCGICHGVEYEPWLYAEHEWCLENHVGKFGFKLCLEKCWNNFSVPIALDGQVDTWGELVAFSGMTGKVAEAYYYDGTQWQTVTATYVLEPLDGIRVFVEEPTCAILLASTGDSWPQRTLTAGWNLIGPNPRFCEDGMPVGAAITPLVDASGAAFSHVISTGSGQTNWVYTLLDWRNGESGPDMLIGRGYWVWMKSDGILSGFGFTPIELYPCGEWHCPNPCDGGCPIMNEAT